jgi:hypothetical protein
MNALVTPVKCVKINLIIGGSVHSSNFDVSMVRDDPKLLDVGGEIPKSQGRG